MSSSPGMLLIVNPVSGKMKTKSYCLPSFFPTYRVTEYQTKDGLSTEEYVRDNAAAYDIVVCAGGDGTLNRVISGLMRLKNPPPLGYLPSGTTNDFATALGIPREIPRAAEAILCGKPTPTDIGSFNSRYFSYVASFGAFTNSSYNAPQQNKNRLGHFAYVLEAMRDFSSLAPRRMTIETEDEVIRGDYIFGAVSNSTSLGGLLRLPTRDVSYHDGLFEVLLIPMPRSATDLQQIVFSLVRQQYNPDYIRFFKTRRLTVSMETIIPWSLDGEYEPGARRIEIKNHTCAISLITEKKEILHA